MPLLVEKFPTDPYSSGTHYKISQQICIYGSDSFQTAVFMLSLRVRTFRVESWILIALWLSRSKPHWFPKLDIMGACFPSADIQGWGCPTWGLDSSLFREDLCVCDIPPTYRLPCQGCRSLPDTFCPSYPSQHGFFFISLIVKDLFS